MWVFKNIITVLLVALLVSTPIFQANAMSNTSKNLAVKEILVSKSELSKVRNGAKYVKAMDALAEKLKNNPEKLEKVSQKINLALYKLDDKYNLSTKEELLYKILRYLDARIEFIKLDNAQKLSEANEDIYNEILESVKNPDISDADKKALEKAVITIQTNLLEKTQQDINSIIWEFEQYFSYENKGDFEMDFNMDHESVWKVQAEMKLTDYVTQNSNFDSRFNGHLSAMINAAPKGEDAVKLEIKSFIDFIMKDGNYYALIKDLNIVTEENLDEVQEFIDTLKELAKENKYIELSSPENKQAIEMIKSIHPDKFFSDAKVLFAKPMFTAYKKTWDKYSIIPTKYACDSLKVLANKFDPFNPDSCTGDQYDDFIKDMLLVGELTMTLGKENVLEYNIHKDNKYVENGNLLIGFTDIDITKLIVNFIPHQTELVNQKLSLSYEKNDHLNMLFYTLNGDIDIKLNSTLDRRNNFSNIDHTAHVKYYGDWNLSLQNRKIDGNLIITSDRWSYNYETGEYEKVEWDGFFSEISGSTDSRNELRSLNITFNGKENGEEYINGDFLYNLPKFRFNVNATNRYSKALINFEWKWNSYDNTVNQLDSNIEVVTKERTYNKETYKYVSTGKETKVFELDYSLEDKNVTGNIAVNDDDWKFVFSVETKGTYEKNKMSLDNEIKFNEELMFKAQSAKARDTTRISNIMLLRTAIEQSYQDHAEYPTLENFKDRVSPYIWEIPSDPKGNIEIDGCKFGYYYEVWADKYWIENWDYKISTCFESKSNADKSKNDGGSDDKRFEMGLNLDTKKEWFYINGYTTWEKVTVAEEIKEEPKINVNFGYDYTKNKANSDIFIEAIFDGKKVLEFMMKNTGTIEYKKIDIKKPTNTTPFQEVIWSDIYY